MPDLPGGIGCVARHDAQSPNDTYLDFIRRKRSTSPNEIKVSFTKILFMQSIV